MADKSISNIESNADYVYRTNMFEVMCQSGDFDALSGTAYYADSCELRTDETVDLDMVKDGQINRAYKFVHWVNN